MTDARTKAVRLMVATNACRKRSDSLGAGFTNGPNPRKVPHNAIAEVRKDKATAPRCPNRNAAHKRGSRAKYPNGAFRSSKGLLAKKTTRPITTATHKTPAASKSCIGVGRMKDFANQISSSGATTTSLTMSPIHQVNQMAQYWSQWAPPL